jgi:hypothetical protein
VNAQSTYDKARKARSAVKQMILAFMEVGWTPDKAGEIVELILEEAEKDGIDVRRFWAALDVIAPIPKDL